MTTTLLDTGPLPPTGAEATTICSAFQRSARRHPDRLALRQLGGVELTWQQYAAQVERAAGALAALGVARGDRVAFLSRNTIELLVAETAATHLGAVGVVLYVASPAATIEHVLRDSRPQVLLVESALAPRLTGVQHEVPAVVGLDARVGAAPALEEVESPSDFDFESRWASVEPDDLLGILYTSGTTGLPKGVEWQHGPMLADLAAFTAAWPEAGPVRDLSVGPMAHAAERGLGHWRGHLTGATRTLCPDPAQLPAALTDARPTFLFGSPQLWQALRAFVLAVATTDERAALDGVLAGAAADPAALAALRARAGLDAVDRAVTAAAPCPVTLQRFFHALGVPFGEFYGMTEIAAATQTRPGVGDLGTTGVPLAGVDVRLAQDGEVLVRGPRARGYRNLPQESAVVFGGDGWTRTGDIGVLDEHGRLRIVDRKREILISSSGHNIAPAPIEAAVKSECALVAQICLVGDGRPYNTALVTVAPAAVVDDDARAQIAAAIDKVNAQLDPREQIAAHAVLNAPWLPGSDELTETGKLRRRQIASRHAATIETLYGGER